MLELLIIIVTLVLDQASKIIAADWLPGLPNATYPLFDGVFEPVSYTHLFIFTAPRCFMIPNA